MRNQTGRFRIVLTEQEKYASMGKRQQLTLRTAVPVAIGFMLELVVAAVVIAAMGLLVVGAWLGRAART